MLVINESVSSCCGHPVANCACGGKKRDVFDSASMPYTGKYSKPSPLGRPVWNFANPLAEEPLRSATEPAPVVPTPMGARAWSYPNPLK